MTQDISLAQTGWPSPYKISRELIGKERAHSILKQVLELPEGAWKEQNTTRETFLKQLVLEMSDLDLELEHTAIEAFEVFSTLYRQWVTELDVRLLQRCIFHGRMALFVSLIRQGVNPNETDRVYRQNTLLNTASLARRNFSEQEQATIMTTVLRARDFTVDEKNIGLLLACREGNVGGVRTLLQHGACVVKDNIFEESALMAGCGHPHLRESLKIVKGLLALNLSKDILNWGWSTGDESALHRAIARGHAPIAQLLVEHGAWVEHPQGLGNSYCTPLTIACRKAQVETVRLLLDNGACATVKDEQGNTLLHQLVNVGGESSDCRHYFSRVQTCTEALLLHGCERDAVNDAGLTANQLAEQCGMPEVAAYFSKLSLDKAVEDQKATARVNSAPHKM